jgi:hypothetical protein
VFLGLTGEYGWQSSDWSAEQIYFNMK